MLLIVQSFLCAALAITAAQAHPSAEGVPDFTLKAAREKRLGDITHTNELATRDLLQNHSLRVMRSLSGSEAIVDESLLHRGVLAAAGTNFVDLSWDPLHKRTTYLLARDGVPLINLTAPIVSYRDTEATPGSTHRYDIVPVLARSETHPKAEHWSLNVHIPARDSSTADHVANIAARAAATTTLSWITFIPESRIDAPTVAGRALCSYGSGYQFGGDGHGFDWTASSYRTAAHAVITWSNKAVLGQTAVGTTHVYEKNSGKLVSQKTASKADMVAKKLPAGTGDSVDIRMVTHATNPYCPGGAIDGAFTATLTKSGSYSIRSGEHRQMPNHHIYIYDGGKVTNVYQRKYANAACLVGPLTCELAQLGGLYGKFA